jgi:hypothetical protein
MGESPNLQCTTCRQCVHNAGNADACLTGRLRTPLADGGPRLRLELLTSFSNSCGAPLILLLHCLLPLVDDVHGVTCSLAGSAADILSSWTPSSLSGLAVESMGAIYL